MGLKMKKLFLLLFCVIMSSMATSQTVDGGFITNVNGSVYEVTLSANMESGIGAAAVITLKFTFNNSILSFSANPVSGTDYSLFGDFANYTTKNITRPQPNTVSVNLITTGTPSPVPLTTSSTNIVTLFFTIINSSVSSSLIWSTTEIAPVFLQDNYTTGNWPNLNNDPLPVELVSFIASNNQNEINLIWQTSTEIDNYGFSVQRSTNGINWDSVGFVPGHGISNSPKEYRYDDKNLPSGKTKLQYRLKQIDNSGKIQYSDIVNVKVVPNKFVLSQNYPNPFNPSTKISYQIMKDGFVTLKVYDVLGKLAKTLISEYQKSGIYNLTFTASDLPSGIYFYQLRAANFTSTKKMQLVK